MGWEMKIKYLAKKRKNGGGGGGGVNTEIVLFR